MFQPSDSDTNSAAGCGDKRPHVRKFLLISALLPGSIYFAGLATIYFMRPLRWPGLGGYDPVTLTLAILGSYGLLALWAMALSPRLRQTVNKPLLASFVLGWLSGGYIVARALVYWAYKADINVLAGDPAMAITAGSVALISFVLLLTLSKFILKILCYSSPAPKA